MSRTIVFAVLLAAGRASAVDQRCPMNATEPAPANARLEGDVLRVGPMSYPPSAYRATADGFELCVCETKPCVRKCCKPGMAHLNETTKCTTLNGPLAQYDYFVVPKIVNASDMVDTYETNYFHIVYGKFSCGKVNEKYRLVPSEIDSSDNFLINETGWLLKPTGMLIAPPGQFCLEQWSSFNFKIVPLICFPQPNDLENTNDCMIDKYTSKLKTFGMILSLPFLLITFLVYALIKDLRNLHGKSLMCHVTTIMIGYTSLILGNLFTDEIENEPCIILGFTCQLSFIASFFWLNVMCFDLWWTFSGFRPIKGNVKECDAKKFIIFSVYAWGFSIIIIALTIYMHFSPNVLSFIPRPGIGNKSCWFDSPSAIMLYFYGPIGILLFGNVVMFTHTAIMIVKHTRHAKVLSGSESNKNVNHEKQRFMLYLKLFIVMGINWLAEIISWSTNDTNMCIIWYITDIGNTLQGVLIFLIFVCKKRVLKLLNKKLCPRFGFVKTSSFISTRTTNSTASRSSNRHRDSIQMSEQSPTLNQLHDFKV